MSKFLKTIAVILSIAFLILLYMFVAYFIEWRKNPILIGNETEATFNGMLILSLVYLGFAVLLGVGLIIVFLAIRKTKLKIKLAEHNNINCK